MKPVAHMNRSELSSEAIASGIRFPDLYNMPELRAAVRVLREQRKRRLWVCHRCQMIGDGLQAGRHLEKTGHEVKELPQALSDEVRAERKKAESQEETERVVGFIAYADFMRKQG